MKNRAPLLLATFLFPFFAGQTRAQEFREVKAGLPALGTNFDSNPMHTAFADFDKDGDMDVLMTGTGENGYPTVMSAYRNDQGRYTLLTDFHELGDSLTHCADWADIDKDGKQDLITWVRVGVPNQYGGIQDSGFIRIYSYDAGRGGFVPRNLSIDVQGLLSNITFSFADVDHDGYPELLVSALSIPYAYGPGTPITRVFHNDKGISFTDITGSIVPVSDAVVAWKDMDEDGDLDLFLAGTPDPNGAGSSSARIYAFNGTDFQVFDSIAVTRKVTSVAWDDIDGDAWPDIILSEDEISTRLYANWGDHFELTPSAYWMDLAAVDTSFGTVSLGDINGDGYPDLLYTLWDYRTTPSHFTKVFTNQGGYFIDLGVQLPPFWYNDAKIVDYDMDGHPDLFMAGTNTDDVGKISVSSKLFRNIRGDFSPVPTDVDDIGGKRARWGDLDNDKDLDLVACGKPVNGTGGGCHVYRNDGGAFVKQSTPMDNLYGDPELGDFDGDGRLDVLLAMDGGGLRLFRNTGAGFEELPLQFTGADPKQISNARFGDYDNDGDLDIVAWGPYTDDIGSQYHCYSGILRNDGGGKFTSVDKGQLPSLCSGEMQWGDFDRDGDLDLLFAGDTAYFSGGSAYTAVYRNDGGTLVQTPDRFLGLSGAKVAWGDFDKDGDLDFAVCGSNMQGGEAGTGGGQNVPTSIVYRLVGGRFEEFYRPSIGEIGDPAWIDYDNDGDLDLVISGFTFIPSSSGSPHVGLTLIYRNDGISFTLEFPEGFNKPEGNVDVGDFDGDGDQDFVVCGTWENPHVVSTGNPMIRIFRNSLIAPNVAPSAPPQPHSTLGNASVALSWGAATDPETPADAMGYNLRLGKSPGASDVAAPASMSPGGYRLMPATGNAGHIQSSTIKGLAPGTYYWSVQAIDNQAAGSPFSPEQSFTLGVPAPVLASAVAGPGPGGVTLRWNKIGQANFLRYYLHYGTSADPVDRMDSVSNAGDTTFTVTGLKNGDTYHFRLSAVDVGGNVSAYSGELTAAPDGTPPAVPDPVSAVPGDRSVTLSWKAATESDFLCYLVYQRNASGPIQKIDSVTDINATSMKIADLKNGTPYSFLVVAVDKVLNHSGFSAEAVAIPAYLLTPSSPAIAFGKINLDAGKDSVLRISNASELPVTVDSVRFVNAAFSLSGTLASLPAKADTALTLRFAPGKPAGGDFAGVFKLYYGGAKVALEIDLSGKATGLPYCRIDKIAPAEVPWDTTASLSFLSTANDSDNAGEGDRITAYLWSSSLAGAFGENASGFTFKPSQLGIGSHAISLRVVDNEGDTSLPASATVTIRSRKPLVRLDSITPAGLVIRGADHPRFRCTAYDLDEGADAAHDSLHAFAVYSTVQGRITSAKDTTLDPDALSLGLHGFYAVAVDDEGDTSVSDTAWVPVQSGIGMALVVAGTDFNDNRYFYENIAPNCNWVYAKLRQRGFTDSLITYFNPVGWQSIGGAYHENSNIVDETRMTGANLKERILGYKSRVRNGVPLVMSFIGHGSRTEQNGKFYLSPTQFVTSDSLNAWLDTFNEDADGHVTDTLKTPIVIVLDFCYSGAFLTKLRSATQNRIVITSASADKQAYFQTGQSFSYAFFKQIAKGGDLAQAWAAGKSWSDANTLIGQDHANPLANADNDNTPNEAEDLALMSQVYIGGSQQDQSPDVHWKDVQVDFVLNSRSITIRAKAEGPAPVDTAWFTLLAPDFDYSAQDKDPFAFTPLLRQPDGSFAGSVKLEPVLSGDYLALVYGLSGSEELMPAAKRCQTLSTMIRIAGTPLRYDLGQNFPNPAVHTTFVPFALTRRGNVSLTVMDMRGRVVRTLAQGVMPAGFYRMLWDGRDGRGRLMPSGVYTYSLVSGEGVRRKKLVWGG